MRPRTVIYEGKTWEVPALARSVGLKPGTLHSRLFDYKMPVVLAIETPVGEHKRRQRGLYKIGIASRRVPGNAHWAVKRLFELIEEHQVPLSSLAKRTGIARETIGIWRYSGNPTFANIEAAFNALGYGFYIKGLGEQDEDDEKENDGRPQNKR